MGEQLVVGRVGRAHGLIGEVAVEVRTDAPEERFADGVALATDPAGLGPLVVESSRPHSGRLLVRFAGVGDRTAAEALRGVFLVIDVDAAGDAGDDAYWDHQLVGLTAVTVDGAPLGPVEEVVHTAAGELLAVRRDDGSELLVPFVAAIVPDVDLAAGRLVVDPPEGLLEL